MTRPFMVTLRGYDMRQVDELLAEARGAAASGDEALKSAAREKMAPARLRTRLRGYARHQVERAFEQLLQELGPGTQRR